MDKILNIKKVTYTSTLNEDHLKQEIEAVFEKSTLSFVGKFTSQNEFAAYDKRSIVSWYVPNFKRKSAYLKGKILNSGQGSILKINLRPNTLLSVSSILAVLIGIIILLAAESTIENTRFIVIGIVFILVGIVSYGFGIFSRNRLHNNFEKNLDLQQV